jgi:hypothetical protein
MAFKFWPDDKASIILLPSGEQGEALLSLAKNWLEVGLLGPAFWLQPEKLDLKSAKPPVIMAQVLGVDEEGLAQSVELDMFEELAKHQLKMIRLLKVRSVSSNREFDELQNEQVETIERYLSYSVPAPDKKLSNIDSRLSVEVVNLICAPTEFEVSSRLNWERTGAGITVIAAAEDRTSPWSADGFMRESKKFIGFTLMHIATVTGIWNGLPTGSLEMVNREKSLPRQIYISRVFFSGVLTDRLAKRVASAALVDAANPEFIPMYPPDGAAFIEESDEEIYIDAMTAAAFALDSGILEYQQPPKLSNPDKGRVGFWKELGDFIVFTCRKVAVIPKFAWLWVKRIFAKRIEEVLEGKEGARKVGVGLEEQLDRQDRLLMATQARIMEEHSAALVAMKSPVRLSSLRSTPSLWSGLRELVFGSTDGGYDLSRHGFTLVAEDKRPIFRSISALFTNPGNQFDFDIASAPTDMPRSITWGDQDKRDKFERQIANYVKDAAAAMNEAIAADQNAKIQIEELTARSNELHDRLVEFDLLTLDNQGNEAIKTLTEANAKVKEMKAAAKYAVAEVAFDEAAEGDVAVGFESTASTASTEEVEVPPLAEFIRDYKKVSADLTKIVAAKDNFLRRADLGLIEATAAEELQHRYADWVQSNSRTFLSKISGRMKETLGKVAKDLESYDRRLKHLLEPGAIPQLGQLIVMRKVFHRRMLIQTGIILAAFAVAANVPGVVKVSTTYPNFWQLVLYGFIALLVCLLGTAAIYHRSWSKWRRAVLLALQDLKSVQDGNKLCRAEQLRLESLYRQTTDWLEALRAATYKPWAVRPSWLEAGIRTLNVQALPLAMRVAQARDNDGAPLEALKSSAERALLVPGWRTKAFNELIAEVGRRAGKSEKNFSIEVLDRDMPHASNQSRALLNTFMADHDVIEHVAAHHLKPLIEFLQTTAMAGARPFVYQVLDDPLAALVGSVDDFHELNEDQEWHQFLKHTLTFGDDRPDPVTPMSVLNIADAEATSAVHESVEAYALMPKNVANEIANHEGIRVSIHTYGDKTARPLDAVVRVDIAGPLSFDAVKLWGSQPAVEDASDEYVSDYKMSSDLTQGVI